MGSLYALVSPGGSPGVTTTAVALALTWPGPSPVIVAECDPGGGDALAGVLGGHTHASRGLVQHAIEAGRNPEAAHANLAGQLVSLDESGSALLLPGLTDPRQAAGLAQAWPAVAETLCAQSREVIADCGRLDGGPGQPVAVLSAAQAVVMVLRPTLRQVWAARPRIDMLADLLGGSDRVGLLLTGPGAYSAREVTEALGVPVLASLPDDAKTAAVLSDGVGRRGKLGSAPLLRSAKIAGEVLRKLPGRAEVGAATAGRAEASTRE